MLKFLFLCKCSLIFLQPRCVPTSSFFTILIHLIETTYFSNTEEQIDSPLEQCMSSVTVHAKHPEDCVKLQNRGQ